jgi:hypothetical protein
MAPAALESPKAAIYGSSQYTPLGEPSKDLSSRSRTSNHAMQWTRDNVRRHG